MQEGDSFSSEDTCFVLQLSIASKEMFFLKAGDTLNVFI